MMIGILALLSWFLMGCGSSSVAIPPASVSQKRIDFVTVTPGAKMLTTKNQPPEVEATKEPTITPTFTPVVITATPLPTPHAVVASRGSTLNVRSGPGQIYDPPIGAYENGNRLEIKGKQRSSEGELWWMISFEVSPSGYGWVYADFTEAYFVDDVPWIAAPPTPTPSPTPTSLPSPTPTATTTPLPPVNWVISGQVVDEVTKKGIAEASVQVTLGSEKTVLDTTTDETGSFVILGKSPDEGELSVTIQASNYAKRTITKESLSPRIYDLAMIELSPTQGSTVQWAILGQVIDAEQNSPIVGAQVEVNLGQDGLQLVTVTDAKGEFSLTGQGRNSGFLVVNITAEGYEPLMIIPDNQDSRIYSLSGLQMKPLASNNCLYESVINLPKEAATTRLTEAGFAAIKYRELVVGDNPTLFGRVLTQRPSSPPGGQPTLVACDTTLELGIGVKE